MTWLFKPYPLGSALQQKAVTSSPKAVRWDHLFLDDTDSYCLCRRPVKCHFYLTVILNGYETLCDNVRPTSPVSWRATIQGVFHKMQMGFHCPGVWREQGCPARFSLRAPYHPTFTSLQPQTVRAVTSTDCFTSKYRFRQLAAGSLLEVILVQRKNANWIPHKIVRQDQHRRREIRALFVLLGEGWKRSWWSTH